VLQIIVIMVAYETCGEALVDFKKNADGFPSILEPYETVLPP